MPNKTHSKAWLPYCLLSQLAPAKQAWLGWPGVVRYGERNMPSNGHHCMIPRAAISVD